MTGDVFVVASGKGGVGKTVTAVNLAVALRLRDESVVVVDGDIGMPNVAAHFGVERSPTLHDVLAEDAALTSALVREADGFAVLPGDADLDGYAQADPARFAYVIDRLVHEFDTVLVDTGGGLSYENALPIQLADEAVLVTTPDPPAVGDTRRTRALVDIVDTDVRGVVVTKVGDDDDPRAVAREVGAPLVGTVPHDDAVEGSVRAGRPLELYDKDSDAARAYRRIAGSFVTDRTSTRRDGVTA